MVTHTNEQALEAAIEKQLTGRCLEEPPPPPPARPRNSATPTSPSVNTTATSSDTRPTSTPGTPSTKPASGPSSTKPSPESSKSSSASAPARRNGTQDPGAVRPADSKIRPSLPPQKRPSGGRRPPDPDVPGPAGQQFRHRPTEFRREHLQQHPAGPLLPGQSAEGPQLPERHRPRQHEPAMGTTAHNEDAETLAFQKIFDEVMLQNRRSELELYKLLADDAAFKAAMQEGLRRYVGE